MHTEKFISVYRWNVCTHLYSSTLPIFIHSVYYIIYLHTHLIIAVLYTFTPSKKCVMYSWEIISSFSFLSVSRVDSNSNFSFRFCTST